MLSGRGIRAADFQRVPIDEEIRAYMRKMKRLNVTDVPAGVRYTRIVVKLAGGETVSAVGDRPKGSAENPVTEDELLRKFADVVRGANAEALRERILRLDELEDVQEFIALLGEG